MLSLRRQVRNEYFFIPDIIILIYDILLISDTLSVTILASHQRVLFGNSSPNTQTFSYTFSIYTSGSNVSAPFFLSVLLITRHTYVLFYF